VFTIKIFPIYNIFIVSLKSGILNLKKIAIQIIFLLIFSLIAKAQPAFTDAIEFGKIKDKKLDEASGLAMSRINSGILWTHNDGDDGRLYGLGLNGSIIAEYKLKKAKPNDWEDMSIGPGPQGGINYIYIADFGDNLARRKTKYILRFPEPNIPRSKKKYKGAINEYDRISFTYKNGNRDAETLLVDPNDKSIYIVTKRETNVFLYQIPYPQNTDMVYELSPIAQLNIGNTGFGKMITAGDISPDGTEILLKDYNNVYLYQRKKSETVKDALLKEPQILPYKKELQGEAICFDQAGIGYFTLSEWAGKENPILYYYHRISPFIRYILFYR
jgi:hypothetical protein